MNQRGLPVIKCTSASPLAARLSRALESTRPHWAPQFLPELLPGEPGLEPEVPPIVAAGGPAGHALHGRAQPPPPPPGAHSSARGGAGGDLRLAASLPGAFSSTAPHTAHWQRSVFSHGSKMVTKRLNKTVRFRDGAPSGASPRPHTPFGAPPSLPADCF